MKADPKIADLLAENKRLRETIKRLEKRNEKLEEKNAIQALHIEAIGKELIEANAVCDAWEAQAHGK